MSHHSIIVGRHLTATVMFVVDRLRWRQRAVAWFETRAGEEVRWVRDGEGREFLQYPTLTRVYLADGWELRHDMYHITRQIHAGRLVPIDPATGCARRIT